MLLAHPALVNRFTNQPQFDPGTFGDYDLNMIMDVGFDRSLFDLLDADLHRN